MSADAVEALRKDLLAHRYVADRGLSMALHLALTLHRPILTWRAHGRVITQLPVCRHIESQ